MADNSELFTTLIQGLSALNQRVNDLEGDEDAIKKELSDFEAQYAKEIKLLQTQIDDTTVQIDRLIKEAVSKIEKPKDGKDFDEDVAKALIRAEIEKLIKVRKLEVAKIKSELFKAVADIQIPKPKDGRDGKNATDLQVQNAVSEWIDKNFNLLKGKDGKDGKSIVGAKGDKGEDGVSIIDAKMINDYLILTFSDNKIKKVKLPKQTKYIGGGASVEATSHIKRDELLSMFNSAYKTSYSELTYTNDDISKIEVYNNDTKGVKLFTKDIFYTDGNISEIKITNEISKEIVIKTISYTDGNISEIRVV